MWIFAFLNNKINNLKHINDSNATTGKGVMSLYTCTAAEYAAIAVKDASTLYFVV